MIRQVLSKTPSIIVYIDKINIPHISKGILLGIEEEGIPYELIEDSFIDPIKQAYKASEESLLDIGVAYNSLGIVLHYSKLPNNSPMFVQTNISDSLARICGINAARMVKGIPFIFKEENSNV